METMRDGRTSATPRRFPLGALRLAVALVVACLLAAGAASAAATTSLRVFAAASLSDAFADIAHAFEAAHPGVKVETNLAGSQQLAAQLTLGAEADVFASADERWMDDVAGKQLLAADPVVFAGNRLVVIVPRTNPARIMRLQDLGKRGVKLVLGADAVPAGRYSRQALQNLSHTDGYPSDYATRVLANLVSEEESVKAVVAKVQLGEADAGMVYRSDVTASVSRYVRVLTLPDSANVLATYPIAVVKAGRHHDLAHAFIDLARSADGQRTLEKRGLVRASAAEAATAAPK